MADHGYCSPLLLRCLDNEYNLPPLYLSMLVAAIEALLHLVLSEIILIGAIDLDETIPVDHQARVHL